MADEFTSLVESLARTALEAAEAAVHVETASAARSRGAAAGGGAQASGAAPGGAARQPKRVTQKSVEKDFVEAYERFQAFTKGLSGFRKCEPAPALVKHIAATAGARAVRALVANVCLLAGAQAPCAADGGAYETASKDECRSALERLGKEFVGLQPPLYALLKAWKQGGDLGAMMDHMQSAAETGLVYLKLKPLSKKAEKQVRLFLFLFHVHFPRPQIYFKLLLPPNIFLLSIGVTAHLRDGKGSHCEVQGCLLSRRAERGGEPAPRCNDSLYQGQEEARVH